MFGKEESRSRNNTNNNPETGNKSAKLSSWMEKNSSQISALITQDSSLTQEDKDELLQAIRSSTCSKQNVSKSTEMKSKGRSKSYNPYNNEKPQLPTNPEHKDLNTKNPDSNRARASSVVVGRVPRVSFTKAMTSTTSSTNSGNDSDDNSNSPQNSGRKSLVNSGNSPLSTPLVSPGRTPGNSPGRTPKKLIVSSSGGILEGTAKKDTAIKESPRKESPRKKSGNVIGRFFNSSSSESLKKTSKAETERKIKSLIIPIDTSTANTYHKYALELFKNKTIIIPSPDKKYDLMVNETDKEVYLLDLDEKNIIGKGGYAKIHPAYNLKTGELVCARVFEPKNGVYAREENTMLLLIDQYFTKHYQQKRHFGFYQSDSERKYVLLKNYEQGMNLQDYLYETNPAGKEYNLCFKAKEAQNTLYLEFGANFIEYTVITPKGDTVTDIIKQEQFTCCQLSKELTLSKLKPFREQLLDLISKREHTHSKAYMDKNKQKYTFCFKIKEELGENTLYLKSGADSLEYTVITPKGETVTDIIKQEQFTYCQFSKELTLDELMPFLNKLLDLTSAREHTHPKYYLNKKDINPFILLKIIYKIIQEVDIYHDISIVHTDLNPKNIIIDFDTNGEPIIKLIDFDSAFSLETAYGYQLKKLKSHSSEKYILYIEEIKDKVLRYSVIDKEGITRTDFINETKLGIPLNDDITEDQLKRHLVKILSITTERQHTYPRNNKNIWPGESPGYLPPTIDGKPWPQDISYDIWQLVLVIAGIITSKHIPDIIRRTHFEGYPTVPTVSIIFEMLDDVIAQKPFVAQAQAQEQEIENNIIDMVYQDMIFPALSALIKSMFLNSSKEIILANEAKKIKYLEEQFIHYLKQINIMFDDTTHLQDTHKAIINMTHNDKPDLELHDAEELQKINKMLVNFFELVKRNLSATSESTRPMF